jgi:hypothetical protein
MSDEGKDEEMICGLTMDEQEVLRRELRELPETMPPRIVWDRIREQGEAEGLLQAKSSGRPTWMAGLAIAASVLLAVILVPKISSTPDLDPVVTEPQPVAAEKDLGLTALQALMVQSRHLESDLRAMPEEPRVMRASTVATIADVENAIAAIDYQLNDPSVQMTEEETELFWRERVRLMKSLVQLRYAQAQRTSF